MQIAPILTKITLPPLPGAFMPRERLLRRFEPGREARLILVAAAAGFGKSSTVLHWLHLVGGWAAWVSLDQGDDDLAIFLQLLVGALQQRDPTIGQQIEVMLQQPTLPPQAVLLGPLLNSLYGWPGHSFIVLDDYHTIQRPEIHEAVNYLLQHLPGSVTLIITTRYDPPLSLSSLRARGQLVEIRADDLRFQPDEAAQFVQAVTSVAIAPDALNKLVERTEGWIAGLQLALIPWRGATDQSLFVTSFAESHRYMMDFLLDEVLMQQPEPIRDFLLRSAVLDRFNAALCDAALERADSQRMIAHLGKLNLFLVGLDGEGVWYRYHRLFVDLLRYRLQERFDTGAIAGLHRRAAAWFADQGMPDDAISHAATVGDYVFVAAIVEKHAYNLLYSEQMSTLQRWLAAIPSSLVQDTIRLQLIHAWLIIRQSRFADLESYLQGLKLQLASPIRIDGEAAADPVVVGEMGALESFLLQWDQAPLDFIRRAEQARAQVPASNRFVHAQLTRVLSMMYTSLNRRDDYEALIQAARSADNERAVLQGYLAHIFVSTLQGELDRAAHTCRMALTLTRKLNALESQVTLYQELGLIAYNRNQLDEAEQFLTQALALGRDLYLLNLLVVPGYTLAWLLHLRGDDAGADSLMQEAEHNAHLHYTPGLVQLFQAAQAALALARGQAAAAMQWADQLDVDFEERPAVRSITLALRQVQCFLTHPNQARLSRAQRIVEHVQALTLNRGLYGLAVYALMEKALLLDTLNHRQQALRTLIEGLELGKRQNSLRFAAEAGPTLDDLLRRFLAEYPASHLNTYVHSLLAVRESTRTAAPDRANPLTDREMEVLNLLIAGFTNDQIAEALVVAVGTVKKHTSTIYEKLAVSNRTQAVLRAQELHLGRPL